MGRHHQNGVLIAFVLVSLFPGASSAKKSKRAQARQHYEQAEAFFKAGAYERAAEEYQQAYEHVPKASLLFNTGLSLENAGDVDGAIMFFERYLKEDPKGPKATETTARLVPLREQREKRRRVAEHRAEAKERAAAKDYAGAIEQIRSARQISTDPELTFELAELLLAAGEDEIALLEYQRYLATPGAQAHGADATARVKELEARRTVGAQEPPSLVPGLVLAGVGAAIELVGLGFGRYARSVSGALDAELEVGNPPVDANDPRFGSGARAAIVADVSFAVGAAALIASAVLIGRVLFYEPSPALDPDLSASSVVGWAW